MAAGTVDERLEELERQTEFLTKQLTRLVDAVADIVDKLTVITSFPEDEKS